MTAYMHICKSKSTLRIVKVPASLPMKSPVETEIHVSAQCLVRQQGSRVDGRARCGFDVAWSESGSLYSVERAGLFTHV